MARRYWDEVAGEWAAARPHRLWREYSDRLLGALLERWWPEGPVGRVLKTDLFDEAFGEGAAPFLEGRARSWVGIDVAGTVVRCAREAHPGLGAVGADVRSLPFSHGAFDLVVSPSTLDHFETREEISASLRELGRVLRIGGVLLLTLDNPRNPVLVARRLLPFGLLRRLGLVPYQTGATLGPGELERVLQAAGFQLRHLGAVLHCPRAPAVALARLLERRGSPAARERFLRGLAWFEGLSRYPTRFLTGHFVAALAVKR
ncbi:MAG: methyltransferase domain-containing protein [Thermodesulfobacteriota bacterium]